MLLGGIQKVRSLRRGRGRVDQKRLKTKIGKFEQIYFLNAPPPPFQRIKHNKNNLKYSTLDKMIHSIAIVALSYYVYTAYLLQTPG